MDWEEYKQRYIISATKEKMYEEQINKNLLYAKYLYQNNVPIIFDSEHFSHILGLEKSYLYEISNNKNKHYRKFKIPKKRNNEFRVIYEPLTDLKIIQRWVLDNILVNIEISNYAKAYRLGFSVKDNARFHRKQNKLIKLDINNFFLQ